MEELTQTRRKLHRAREPDFHRSTELRQEQTI